MVNAPPLGLGIVYAFPTFNIVRGGWGDEKPQCAQFVETLVGIVETLIETLVETVVNTCECCRNVETAKLRVLKH